MPTHLGGDAFVSRSVRCARSFYLLLAGGGEEPGAAGESIMARANASIAIFQLPFSRFRILTSCPGWSRL
jgi:hypothetical protein